MREDLLYRFYGRVSALRDMRLHASATIAEKDRLIGSLYETAAERLRAIEELDVALRSARDEAPLQSERAAAVITERDGPIRGLDETAADRLRRRVQC
jgi:hypothetical protein